MTPIFRYFFTELPIPPQAAGVIGTFECAFIYIYYFELYGLIFRGYLVTFTRSPFLFCVHFHFLASTLCMCVMYLTSFDGFF